MPVQQTVAADTQRVQGVSPLPATTTPTLPNACLYTQQHRTHRHAADSSARVHQGTTLLPRHTASATTAAAA